MAERKTWTDEQKAEILKKAEETSMLAASKEFGVARTTIIAWKKKADADKVAAAAEIEVKKTAAKATRKAKETVKKVEAAAKKPVAKAKAAKLEIIVQSPMGGNITAEEIAAKLPEGAECVFVRVDQNKLWWIKGEETGSVDIWD